MTKLDISLPGLHPVAESVLKLLFDRENDLTAEEALSAVGFALGIAMTVRSAMGLREPDEFANLLTAQMAAGGEHARKVVVESYISKLGGLQ